MAVVPLTITISLCLVFSFIAFFLVEHARARLSGADRDSLLPLREETPRLVPLRAEHSGSRHIAKTPCGCEDGSHPPCAGCLKRASGE